MPCFPSSVLGLPIHILEKQASFSSVLISFPGASTDQSQIQFQIQRHAFNWPA